MLSVIPKTFLNEPFDTGTGKGKRSKPMLPSWAWIQVCFDLFGYSCSFATYHKPYQSFAG